MEFGMLIEDLRNVQAWLGHGDIQKAHEYLESIIVSLESAQLQRSPDKGGDWLCKNCNCANLPVDNACTSCGTPRPCG